MQGVVQGLFTISGIKIKNPTSFRQEFYTITDADRTADGEMVMEFIANKKRFTLGWEAITHDEFNVIADILWHQVPTTKKVFHPFRYPLPEAPFYGVSTIYAGALPHQLHSAKSRRWVWTDFQVNLIEQ